MPRNGYKKGRSRGCVQIFPLCSFKFIFSPSLFQIHILSHFLSLELSTLSKIYQHELLRPRECMCQFFFGTDAVQELKAWSSKTASGCKALEESFPQHPRIKCVRKTNGTNEYTLKQGSDQEVTGQQRGCCVGDWERFLGKSPGDKTVVTSGAFLVFLDTEYHCHLSH